MLQSKHRLELLFLSKAIVVIDRIAIRTEYNERPKHSPRCLRLLFILFRGYKKNTWWFRFRVRNSTTLVLCLTVGGGRVARLLSRQS